MTDKQIYSLLKEKTGLSSSDIVDYRPCSRPYTDDLGIPGIKNAIIIQLKGNGKIIYIPDRDIDGSIIERQKEGHNEGAGPAKIKIVIQDGVVDFAMLYLMEE